MGSWRLLQLWHGQRRAQVMPEVEHDVRRPQRRQQLANHFGRRLRPFWSPFRVDAALATRVARPPRAVHLEPTPQLQEREFGSTVKPSKAILHRRRRCKAAITTSVAVALIVDHCRRPLEEAAPVEPLCQPFSSMLRLTTLPVNLASSSCCSSRPWRQAKASDRYWKRKVESPRKRMWV